jgi:septum formation protein
VTAPPGASAGRLILASASPRRRELLERVGFSLEVRPADIDETERPGEDPAAYVARLARAKVDEIARASRDRDPGAWVLAADTTVTIDGAILGKAATAAEAAEMLRRLSGRVHQVMTAFAISSGGRRRDAVVSSDVAMIELDEPALDDYLASGEWRGKAGAYAIQGIAAALVREVRGSVTNVIGLPLAEVIAALRELGGPEPRLAAGSAS